MPLISLGGLDIPDSDFGRRKPLLLLTYLAFQGPQEKRYLASLFWPESKNPLGDLAMVLYRLKSGVAGSVGNDAQRAWARIDLDATDLVASFREKELEKVVDLYHGPFLQGIERHRWMSLEIEDWILETREHLAGLVREALLRLAERFASQGAFDRAGALAERAWALEGAGAVEPEQFGRFHHLLAAAEVTSVAELRSLALDEYGIALRTTPAAARLKLQQIVVGRDDELEQLNGLAPGQWAWLRGGPGLGKTTLLRHLPGTYLPARSGIAYRTLEPLIESGFEEGLDEGALLRRMRQQRGLLLIDDWERIDNDSLEFLRRLRQLAPADLRIVLASREPPQLPVDIEVRLAPIAPVHLEPFDGAWEQTRGIPTLVGAFLRHEPLGPALETRIESLGETSASLFLCLTLLESVVGGEGPRLTVARQALELEASSFAAAQEALFASGLIESSGAVRGSVVALEAMERSRPVQLNRLALALALRLPPIDALPLFERSRVLWRDGDLPAIEKAYLTSSQALLMRGLPGRSAELLTEAPGGSEMRFFEALAWERAGKFQVALDRTRGLPETVSVLALQAALHWRLGRAELARELATRALDGEDSWARAQALTTLGNLDRAAGNYPAALRNYRRAGVLWRSLDRQDRWVDVLNNSAIVRAVRGDPIETVRAAFEEALDAAGENVLLRTRVLTNLARTWERLGSVEKAIAMFKQALDLAREGGAVAVAARAWNNLGALHWRLGNDDEARVMYDEAYRTALEAGEQRIMGIVLANKAELDGDFEGLSEALLLLERSGFGAEAEMIRKEVEESLRRGVRT